MISPGRKPVVVSLTPLPLSADSRTLKQVTSVHRFGFESIVVEGKESGFADGALPFEVISIHPRDNAAAASASKPKGDAQKDGTSKSNTGGTTASEIQAPRQPAEALSFQPSQQVKFVARCIPGGKRLLRPVFSRLLKTTAHPRAFAGHLVLYLKQYFLRVLSVTPRADLYYLHAFYQFPAVFLLCLRYRAKMIYDAHDFYSQLEDDASFSSYWKNWVLPFERIVERLCVWFASEVVTVNEGIAALMRERFGCEPVILRNVHDLRLDRAPATTIRERIGLPPDAFLVVSIGNWKKGMAMGQMFDALAALPKHVHLAFLGGGYPSLDEATTSRGIEARVHLVKPVLPQEVVPFISSADASVVLYFGKSVNYQNALPNRFFQSIAAKLPLVYPNLNEIRRLADQYGVGIMADPQKPAEIETAIRVLAEDPHRRDEIRKNLQVASRELSWEREEKVLRRLLDRHLGRAESPLPNVQNQVAG